MSIQLSQDERDHLEQLARRKMKPTRRQKAIALLRLAEGDTPEKAALYAGIHEEDVAALASKFSEQGLAGVGLGGKSEILVALIAGVMRGFERVVALPDPKDIEFPQAAETVS